MEFYTNVYQRGDLIYYRGYKDNKRISSKIPYRPYLFVPTNNESQFKTLKGNNVDKLSFGTIKEAKEFTKQYEHVDNFKIYGLDRFVYCYINDNFPGSVDYDINRILNVVLDIEVASDEGFPDISTASQPLTLIGNRIGNKRIIFGYEDYQSKDKNVNFVRCQDEEHMIKSFLTWWKDIDPDVVSGWNVERFDIPYLVNRITRLYGVEKAKELSPWNILQEKTVTIRGRDFQVFIPVGISILDYYDIYRKFTYTQLESYTLDHVAFVETGKGKLDYSEYDSLNELYKKNYEKFVDYNIIDLDRVVEIDDKNKFFELVYAIAYDAKINFIDAMTSVLLWDIIIHNYLMSQNIVIPSKNETATAGLVEGAYVKDPQIGMHKWVVSFDLTSLYPHLIMQYNISPETLVDFKHNVMQEILDRKYDNQIILDRNQTQAANGCRYTKKYQGFLPKLMKLQFDQRVEYKNKMIAAKKKYEQTHDESLKNDIARYNNAQMAKKIQLNSAYGAIANQWFRFYDQKNAEAITLSGQLSTRWIEKALNSYLQKICKTNRDYVIAADTDSVYLNFGQIFEDIGREPNIDIINNLCSKTLQNVINESYNELAKIVNAYENAMSMKREAIADKGIWTAKKRYILNVIDNEGVRYTEPELKMMGIEAIRSSTPTVVREFIKETLKIIMSATEEDVQKYIKECKIKFKSMKFEDIAFPRGVNGMNKYADKQTIYKKGCPIHVKASLIYNDLIKKHALTSKYHLIYDKEKVKWAYLKQPNPFFSHVIATQRNMPPQFEIEKYIDYDVQFNKSFLDPMSHILECIGWQAEKTQTLENFFS